MKVEAKWSGGYPCLCSGEWTLFIDGKNVSDKIPKDLINEPMHTNGVYSSWQFGSDWEEEWNNYEDGLECEDWIKENKEWLDNSKEVDKVISKVPLKILFEADEIARFAKNILDLFASYTTGSDFIIDGGRSLV